MIPKNYNNKFRLNQLHLKKFKKYIKKIYIYFFGVTIFFVILYKRINPPITSFIITRFFGQVFSSYDIKLKKNRINIENIPSNVIYATIGGEDQLFLDHFGFDFKSIKKAYQYNQKNNSLILGASTITQQTAKNLFLWSSRSYIRKGFEVYFTILLEILRSKERILEIYLNIIEFGNGIYGIQSASLYYFDKPLEKLNNSQIAFLVSILPNPRFYENNRNIYQLNIRKNSIINSLYKIKNNKTYQNFVKNIKE
ncbi:monofunctional biosynthetic peptidoglycan transglycosylase [Candidatus Gracilibacteria bacterium]|nr:monofunctional biosynthetic peptidoglycan transglycosylase [Candidatus Gracilibacteria bacterium]